MSRYEQTRRRPKVGEVWVRKNNDIRVKITNVDPHGRWVAWKLLTNTWGTKRDGDPLMSTFLANYRHEDEVAP